MMYLAYQNQANMMAPLRALAEQALPSLRLAAGDNPFLRGFAAAAEMLSRAGLSHGRPPYNIDHVKIGNRDVPVVEEAAHVTPFGTLLHFRKDVDASKVQLGEQPRVLVVAPLSGHFATLLRDTVVTMLPDHDVYITDWHNARDVPLDHGRFGLDEYVEHLISFLEEIGPAHVIAVCQPCVQALAAVAVMAEQKNPAQPRSMTLMAGPIDTRINPGKVNELACSQSIEWFERNVVTDVPYRYAGARRKVYPGFIQLAAFMQMNMERHITAHSDLFHSLARGDWKKADTIKAFYDEYLSVSDLPAEFYLETVRTVFQEHALPRGTMTFKGKPIRPAAIRRTALLTVEGERDDICPVGQTVAAHDLLTGLKPGMKQRYLQPGAGHYGVFSGKRWETQVYPLVRAFIRAND